ncbi:MAG: AbfB domain-containing protein [Nannocystaceae bacterium]
MGFLKSISSPFVDAANAVADVVVDTSNTIVDGAKAAADGIADTTISAIDEAEGVALAVGGAMVDAADVVGTTVATFGSQVECFSVAAGGAVVDWTETAAQDVAALSESLASNIRTFSPVLYDGLKIAVTEVWEAIASLFGSELPELKEPDSNAKLVAQLIFSFVFTEAMEAACRRNGTTIGWGITFEGGIGLGGSVLVGIYCDSDGAWGFYEGTDGLPASVDAEFTNGLTVTIDSIVVFGSRDDFSGTRVIDPGIELQVGSFVAGASVLIKRSNMRFLGFTTSFGVGVSPQSRSNAQAVEAAKQSPAAKQAHLAEYAFKFTGPNPGGVLELLDDSSDVTDLGASAELAVDAARDPAGAEQRRRLATAGSFPPFEPMFIGTISAPQYPNHRLVFSGSFGLKLSSEGTPVQFRLRASADDPSLVVLQCLGEGEGHIFPMGSGGVGHGPLPTENVFRMVKGLRDGGGGVSFQSVEFPNRYLRYYYFDLVCHEHNAHPTFREEATFTLVHEPDYDVRQSSVILPGQVITPSTYASRISADGRAAMWFSSEGRISTGIWWSPANSGSEAPELVMDTDRLKIFRGATKVWESDVLGEPGPCFAAITNEQHLAIFRGRPDDPGALVWSSKDGAVRWWTSRRTVALQAWNGSFVAPNDAEALRADRSGLGAGELMTMFTLYDGQVAFRGSNGRYVCAEHGGGSTVVVNRDAIGPWECFQLIESSEGWVSLKAVNNQYVCAENGGGGEINANRNAIGPWERFALHEVDQRCGWEPIGGVISSSPAGLHRSTGGEGEVEILALGPNRTLVSLRHTPNEGWGSWETITTEAESSPAICQMGTTTLRAVRGADRAIRLSSGENGALGSWEWCGGLWVYGPAITSWSPGRLDLWTVGDDKNLQQRACVAGNWEDWYNHGGNLTAAPSGASMHDGHHTICARGTDNAVWFRTFDGGWTGWTSLGGIVTAAPSLVARSSSAMDLFVRGTDMALWRKRYVNGSWSGYERLGGNLASAPAAVVMHDRVDVYARAADGGLMRFALDATWCSHGGGFSSLVGGGDRLYAIQSSTGDIVRVNGASGSVTKIGDPGHAFVAGAGWIAGITTDKSAVYRYDGGAWTKVGDAAEALVASRDALYAVLPSGELHRWEGGVTWRKIGDPADRFVAGDGFVAQITTDKSAVRMWSGGAWVTIGGAMTSLVVGGAVLYGVVANGDIYRYDGQPNAWTKVGGPGHAFAGADGLLSGITPDKQDVYMRRRTIPWRGLTGSPGGLQALTVIGSRIYALTDSGVIYGHEI